MNSDQRRKRPPAGRDKNKSNSQQQRLPKNARELAFKLLSEQRETDQFLQALFDKQTRSLPNADQFGRLAHEMAWGIVRRRNTLATIIVAQTQRDEETIEDDLWLILEIGVYQLVFLDSIPDHAAIHETVELVKRYGKKRWTGFVNGVLRGIGRCLTEERGDTPSETAIPLTNGAYRYYSKPIFANPGDQPASYFAEAFSFPEELAERWQDRFEAETLFKLGFRFNAPTPPTLRINTLNASIETVQQMFVDEGIASGIVTGTAQSGPQHIQLYSSMRIEQLPGYEEGLFVVQDATAMQASLLLDPRPGDRVLDLCAAPGTKTTHIAQLMNNEGAIVATDVSENRLKRVHGNCRRLGIEIVETAVISHNGSDIPAGPFDRILVDVPCSNTGVLGKRPEARWRVSQEGIDELFQLQCELLDLCLDRLAPAGQLVYSTCSIEPIENSHVVSEVSQQRGDVTLVEEREILPESHSDGGYQALLKLKSN